MTGRARAKVMRSILRLTCCLLLAVQMRGGAEAQTDVPAGHWARPAVIIVVKTGVMTAPAGKFQGGLPVTRRELAGIMVRLSRSLEAGAWRGFPTRHAPDTKLTPDDGALTRYELAAVIARLAPDLQAGIPKPSGKSYLHSVALPPRPAMTLARTDAAYSDVSYLIQNRMLFEPSVLLKPAGAAVTANQVVAVLTQMIAGLTDRLTDEPENREELGPPPARERGDRPPKTNPHR